MKSDTQPAFIADCHLGKLAKYLRLMGFDTLYFTHISDNDLIALANAENRIILTHDKGLFERKKAPCHLLKSTEIKVQLRELIDTYDLKAYKNPFSRCIVCNTPLQSIEKSEIIHRVPEKIKTHFSHFEICTQCDRIYWHGDHYRHMKRFIDSVLEEN